MDHRESHGNLGMSSQPSIMFLMPPPKIQSSAEVLINVEYNNTKKSFTVDADEYASQVVNEVCAGFGIDFEREPYTDFTLEHRDANTGKILHLIDDKLSHQVSLSNGGDFQLTKKKEQAVMIFLEFITEGRAQEENQSADNDTSDSAGETKKRMFNLKNLLLNDVAFAEEFISQDGVPILAEFVVQQEGNTLSYALAALKNLFTYMSALGVLSDDPERGISIMKNVYQLLDHENMVTHPYHPNIYRNALEILIVLVNFVENGAQLLHQTAKSVSRIAQTEASSGKQALSGIDLLKRKYQQPQQEQSMFQGSNEPYTNFAILLSKDDVDIKTNLVTLLNLMLSKTPKKSVLRKKMVLYWQKANIVKLLSTMVDIQSNSFRSQLELFQRQSNVTIPRSWLEVEQLKRELEQLKRVKVSLQMMVNEYSRQQPYVHVLKDELLRCYREMGTMATTRSNPAVSFATHPQTRITAEQNTEATSFQDPESFTRSIGIGTDEVSEPVSNNEQSEESKKESVETSSQPEKRPRPGLPDAEAEIERLQQRISELEAILSKQDAQIDHMKGQREMVSVTVQTVISGEIEKVSKNEKMSQLQSKLAGLLGSSTAKKEDSFLSPSEFEEITGNALFDERIAKDPKWEWNETKEREKELQRQREWEKEECERKVLREMGEQSIDEPTSAKEVAQTNVEQPVSTTSKKEESTTTSSESPSAPAPAAYPDASGAPPPPPPPLPGAPSAPGILKLSKPEEKPGQKLRQLHWKRIVTTDTDTIWGQLHGRYSAFQFDKNQFEHLFAVKENTFTAGSTHTNSNDENDAAPVRLLEDKRFNMLSIILHKLPDVNKIQKAVLTFDNQALTREQLQVILQAVPTKEERELFQQHLDNPTLLKGQPEQFIAMVMKTPVFEERVRSWLFIIDFKETVHEEVMVPLECCDHCVAEVISSPSLRLVLGYVLRLGNFMNGGNARRGRADGFDINTLMKLNNTKDRFNKTSLMDYVCNLVRKNHPAAAEELPKELKNVLTNYKRQHSANLDKAIQKLITKLRNFENDTNTMLLKVPDHTEDLGIQSLQGFLDRASQQVEHIDTSYTEFLKQFREMMHYLGISRAQQERTKPHDVLEPLGYFVDCYFSIMQQFERKRTQQRSAGMRINGMDVGDKQQDPMSSVVVELQMQMIRQRAATRMAK